MYEHEHVHTHHGAANIIHWGRVWGRKMKVRWELREKRLSLIPCALHPGRLLSAAFCHTAVCDSSCQQVNNFMMTQDATRARSDGVREHIEVSG